jgi:hypothetical protein
VTTDVYEISHLKLVPKRHYGRIVGAAAVLLVLALIVLPSRSGRSNGPWWPIS